MSETGLRDCIKAVIRQACDEHRHNWSEYGAGEFSEAALDRFTDRIIQQAVTDTNALLLTGREVQVANFTEALDYINAYHGRVADLTRRWRRDWDEDDES
jgi:hypothetical protein